MGEGGLVVPPPGYFERVKDILGEMGAPFIADEVQSGFARSGKMFAIEHWDVEPDVICMAKGVANGWPLGAFISRSEIADAFEPGDHLSTFGGNPVSCAASLANLEYFDEVDLCRQSADKGAALKAHFEGLMAEQTLIGEVRGEGLMVGVELVEDRTTKKPASAAAGFVRQYCLDHGVLIGVGGNFASVLRVQPPLVISQLRLDNVSVTIVDGLEAAKKAGVAG
jgi:4-aminobutyrate aminotransferase-like enzyme